MTLADAGSTGDPLVGSFHPLARQFRNQISVADPMGWQEAAGAGDAGIACHSMNRI
jgi:hypothetical protein